MIWGGKWEGGSGLGTHVHPWLIHVNVWQNQYSIVKQNKVKLKIKKIKQIIQDEPFFHFISLFMYLWLHWVLVAFVQAFSSCESEV